MPPPEPPHLNIALIGPGGDELAQAAHDALQALLPQACAGVRWHPCLQVEQAATAQLRWLLPWREHSNADLAELRTHQALRLSLHQLGLSYQALRGTPAQQLGQALQSLQPWLPELQSRLPPVGVTSRRPDWSCSDCSDPDCEHRSFTALLAGRDSPG
jgi:hypothetical protein